MKIWSHTLVRNEERYIWYSLKSVVDFVDKMLVWDTGSNDNTVEIIKEFQKQHPNKVEFNQVGKVDKDSYTQKRQEMLEITDSDWFLILDGDEVWWQDSLYKIVSCLQKRCKKLDSIVTPYYNIIGDIYHFQHESAAQYTIDRRTGHITIRFMNRKIPGLYTSRPHGQHGYFDENDVLIQDRSRKARLFLKAPFMHFTHMIRSSGLEKDKQVIKRSWKYKVELGVEFPADFFYPEVFFMERPDFVRPPWSRRSFDYRFRARMLNIPKQVKRKFWKGSKGY